MGAGPGFRRVNPAASLKPAWWALHAVLLVGSFRRVNPAASLKPDYDDPLVTILTSVSAG